MDVCAGVGVCVCDPGSLIGRALSRKDRGAGFESRSCILLLQHTYCCLGDGYTHSHTHRVLHGSRSGL